MSEQSQYQTKSILTQPFTAVQTGILQRKCGCGKHTIAGDKCDDCEDKKNVLQRKASNSSEHAEIPPIVYEVLSNSGQPLDARTRAFMEPRFGHDFGGVRIHTDTRAAESAKSVNALAYTFGRSIVFGQGQFSPHTNNGKHLLAHELTHFVQQSGAANSLQKFAGDESGDILEKDAEKTAKQVVEEGDTKPTPVDKTPAEKTDKKKKDKPKFPTCDRSIWFEGTCQFLVDKSGYNCCDPEKGLTSSNKNRKDVEGKECPSKKFTPIFSCDKNCKNALAKRCDDNDNWMAAPKNMYKCGDQLTICYNGKSTKGYVRDNSVVDKYEVSPGIKKALGVTEKQGFQGAIYRPGVTQDKIDKDPCCKS